MLFRWRITGGILVFVVGKSYMRAYGRRGKSTALNGNALVKKLPLSWRKSGWLGFYGTPFSYDLERLFKPFLKITIFSQLMFYLGFNPLCITDLWQFSSVIRKTGQNSILRYWGKTKSWEKKILFTYGISQQSIHPSLQVFPLQVHEACKWTRPKLLNPIYVNIKTEYLVLLHHLLWNPQSGFSIAIMGPGSDYNKSFSS